MTKLTWILTFGWLLFYIMLSLTVAPHLRADAPAPTAGPFCPAPVYYLMADGSVTVGSKMVPCHTLRRQEV